ncbi:endonuclease/exonuclease/phosphatase family protein [Actinomyces capricornis]|uniref:Endonuclease n=1 Tax=Actinomyces capricornis TaxID=2755559 RepID=A0ABM7UBN0_9ACTO|nr:endonuclease/exonuclease/phosphatase family protein [Actinomyces capricornis]BDA64669.1 endonuclease [Actinomyces capricornis]
MRVLSLNLQHGLPGVGAGDGSAATGSLAKADITSPATARTVMEALAEQIAELAPDVVALQEVDLGQPRSGRLDQAAFLARALDMSFHRFAASYAGPAVGLRRRPLRAELTAARHDPLGLLRATVGAGPIGYGNALLSRHPVEAWGDLRLGRGPSSWVRRGKNAWDPRSYKVFTASNRVMVTAVITLPDGTRLSAASTHLATRGDTAAKQLAAAWRHLSELPGPHLLIGDYNLREEHLAALGIGRALGQGPTFPAAAPAHRIDHLLTDPWPVDATGRPLSPTEAAASRTLLRATDWGTRTFVVSDHVGTWVDLEPVR